MLAVYKQVEKEKKAKIKELFKEENSKLEKIKIFTHITFSFEDFFSKDLLKKKKNSLDKEESN